MKERDPFLDALRGLALLGILGANLLFFKALNVLDPTPSPGELADPWDLGGYTLLLALAVGKFYPLFAALFGAGLALMAQRLEAQGLPLGALCRRLWALGLLGLLHGLLLWPGDILLPYALAGALALPFLGRPPLLLLGWGLGLLALGGLLVLPALPGEGEGVRPLVQALREAGQGGLPPWPLRLAEWGLALLGTLFALPSLLGLLLLGMAAVGAGLPGGLPRLGRVLGGLASLLPPLLLLHGFLAWRAAEAAAGGRLGEAHLWGGLLLVAGPFLALGYAALLGSLWLRLPSPARTLLPLVRAGRMSLSLYLLQTLVGLALFRGGGPEPGYALLPPLALGIWLLQVLLAHLWLGRFPQGPLEGLWRRLAYGDGGAGPRGR